MRKNALLFGISTVLAVAIGFGINVERFSVDGFVGPDLFGESDSFFTVYDLGDGHILADVAIDVNRFCAFPGLCIELGDLGYVGDRPQMGDRVQVREYNLGFPWEFIFTYVEKLPQIDHAEAVPPRVTITTYVNGQEVGTYDDLGEATSDALFLALP